MVVVVPLAAGAPVDATEEAAAGGAELAGSGETTAVDVASGGAEEAPVAKTPGEPAEEAPEAGAEEVAGGLVPASDDVGDAAGEVLTEEGLPGATSATPPQTTCGGKLVSIVPLTTEEPGSG